jgi:serine protease inhibitor
VQLPRFELRSTSRLRVPLQQLGMTLAFDEGKADFRGMSAREGLFMQEAYHEVFVKVDEEGTEAAAATAAHVMAGSRRSPPKYRFIADHPFLFAIRHHPSGTLLFLGRFVAPAAASN